MLKKVLCAILPLLFNTQASAQMIIYDEVGADTLTSSTSRQPIPVRNDFTYDDAGNIIIQMVLYYNPPPYQLYSETKENTMIDNYNVTVSTDETWANVCVAISNLKDDAATILSVTNLSGITYYKAKIEGGNTNLNLSHLKKGIYLFGITSKMGNKSYKIVKR